MYGRLPLINLVGVDIVSTCSRFPVVAVTLKIRITAVVQGDSLARGPKLLSIKNYGNQLMDDELTTGYYQQDGATCHTSNASM